MQQVKVLVVEDDVISQRVVQIALENKNYQVQVAATGKEALALYQANYYDLILMDMGLPDMTGIDVTLAIRKIEQGLGLHTPIIALTAHGLSAKPECLEAGMDDLIAKPVDIEQLPIIIESWIEKSN